MILISTTILSNMALHYNPRVCLTDLPLIKFNEKTPLGRKINTNR